MGLFFNRKLENGATISVWEIVESEEQLLLLSSISKDELEKLQLIQSAARRKEKLAVRALIDEILDDSLLLDHSDSGRPFLKNSHIEISISHTSRFASIITHSLERVGIDIELLSRNFTSVEKKALSKKEIENLCDSDSGNRNLHLAIHWSAKEAIFKRVSVEGVDFSKQILIKKFTPKESGQLTAIFRGNKGDEQEFKIEYEIFQDHLMAWIVG